MAELQVDFRFTCPFCGSNSLELPEGFTDDSTATCGGCGSDIGRWGNIKAQALAMKPAEEPSKFKGFSNQTISPSSRK